MAIYTVAPGSSIQTAYDRAVPGDTILLGAGIHKPTTTLKFNRAGSSALPITVAGAPGTRPIIDASAGTDWGVYMIGTTYNVLRNLELTKCANGGIYIENASNNILDDLDIHHNGRAGSEGKGVLMLGQSKSNLLLNIDSHHNQDISLGNSDGFQIAPYGTGTGNILRGCRAWANSDDGFDFFNVNDNTTTAPVLVEDCWAWGNGYNVITGAAAGNGRGFKLAGMRPNTTTRSGGHTLRNCMAWKNRDCNYADEQDALIGLKLDRCTAYESATYNYQMNGRGTRVHTITSCTAVGNGQTNTDGAVTVLGCSWQLGLVPVASDFVSLDDTKARGPRQANGALPTTDFLRPTPGGRLNGIGASPPSVSPTPTPAPTPTPTPAPPASTIISGTFRIDTDTVTRKITVTAL